MRETVASKYEPGTDAYRFACKIDLEREIHQRTIREHALDRAIQSRGGHETPEELVSAAKLFTAFLDAGS